MVPFLQAPTGGTEKRNEKDLRQERQELMLKQQEAIRMKQNRKAMELEAAKTKVVGAAKVRPAFIFKLVLLI